MSHRVACRFAVKKSSEEREQELAKERVQSFAWTMEAMGERAGKTAFHAALTSTDVQARQELLAALDTAVPVLHRLHRELRRLVRVTVTDGSRCRHCDGPMPVGSRKGRLYCSRTCRQRAYEARRDERVTPAERVPL
jgi:hypothetical protein